MQGYQTLLDEIDTQLGGAPDLVAVPVGVGSLAEAVVRHYRRPSAAHPSVLSVEPDTAACVLASLTSARATTVATAATVMAGLNCGTISSSAWPVLRAGCDAAVTVSDQDALRAVADLDRLGVSRALAGRPPWPEPGPLSPNPTGGLPSASMTTPSSFCSARKDTPDDPRRAHQPRRDPAPGRPAMTATT